MERSSSSTQRITVVVADPQERARSGLVALLDTCADLEVVGEAERGADVVCRAERRPAVVLLDVGAAGSDPAAGVRSIRDRLPGSAVVIMTLDPTLVDEAESAGADAVVLKGGSSDVLLRTVRSFVRGTQGEHAEGTHV